MWVILILVFLLNSIVINKPKNILWLFVSNSLVWFDMQKGIFVYLLISKGDDTYYHFVS